LIDFDNDGGEIMVDGIDIRDLPLGDYRGAMSIVPQGKSAGSVGADIRSTTIGAHFEGELGSRRSTFRRRDMGCLG
jgi:hypothetical protein